MALSRSAESEALRKVALTRLAVATRERLPEDKRERDAFFRIYLDDLAAFSDDTFVRACRRLETVLSWFPKKAELMDACQQIVRQRAERNRPRLALAAGDREITPEKHAEIMGKFRAVLQRRGMPS